MPLCLERKIGMTQFRIWVECAQGHTKTGGLSDLLDRDMFIKMSRICPCRQSSREDLSSTF